HQFSGAASLVLAIGAFPVFGLVAALGMALLGGGNLLAARGVKADGEVQPLAKALMIVGALTFVAGVVVALRLV
ncbi:MAG: hypothetical protein ABJB93_12955, partial [Gaiellales bacterium]